MKFQKSISIYQIRVNHLIFFGWKQLNTHSQLVLQNLLKKLNVLMIWLKSCMLEKKAKKWFYLVKYHLQSIGSFFRVRVCVRFYFKVNIWNRVELEHQNWLKLDPYTGTGTYGRVISSKIFEPNCSDIMENYRTVRRTLEFMHGPRLVLRITKQNFHPFLERQITRKSWSGREMYPAWARIVKNSKMKIFWI